MAYSDLDATTASPENAAGVDTMAKGDGNPGKDRSMVDK